MAERCYSVASLAVDEQLQVRAESVIQSSVALVNPVSCTTCQRLPRSSVNRNVSNSANSYDDSIEIISLDNRLSGRGGLQNETGMRSSSVYSDDGRFIIHRDQTPSSFSDIHLPVGVPSDTSGRTGMKKIAKLWRFLTKRRAPVRSHCDAASGPMTCEEDSLSVTGNSCLCGGLRRSCPHPSRDTQSVLCDADMVSNNGEMADSERCRVQPQPQDEIITLSLADIQPMFLGAPGRWSAAARMDETVAASATPAVRHGAYRNLCCGSGGNRSLGSSSSNSLASFAADIQMDSIQCFGQIDNAATSVFNPVDEAVTPQHGRLVSMTVYPTDGDQELIASHDVSSSSSLASSAAIPPVFPRVSATIHTQIDYVHCLVPELARIAACVYYWGVMDRYEAERLLDGRPEGTFLLRDSAQEEFLFSVSFRRYGRSLHARVEQWNHRFSFDSHDASVFSSPSVRELIEHYKDPASCMFFEPLLTAPLPRTFPFSLQALCRTAICERTSYDGIAALPVPKALQRYLQYYHYKQKVRVRRFEAPPPPAPPVRPLPPIARPPQQESYP